MNRKSFLLTLGGSVGVGILSNPLLGQPEPKPVVIPSDKVKEFVGASHSNLDKVKNLVVEFPNLVYASWDWGGGDFESGIEAAGHVGRKDIAQYLLDKGSRSNIFLLTMMGKFDLIQQYLTTFPDHLTMRGPHGFSLLHHAMKGGEEATRLVEYLQGLGLKETKFSL